MEKLVLSFYGQKYKLEANLAKLLSLTHNPLPAEFTFFTLPYRNT